MARRLFLNVAAISVTSISALAQAADTGGWIGPAPQQGPTEVRSGGVLSESYAYHRQGGVVQPSVAQAAPTSATHGSPWYGYGFPVQTYRWGWFGAEHYYPTVLWHRGFYGDECRWAYRRGY